MTNASPRRGRPSLLKEPRRINVYLEAAFASDLKRLARFISAEVGRSVSVSQAITLAVLASPQFAAMTRRKGKGDVSPKAR